MGIAVQSVLSTVGGPGGQGVTVSFGIVSTLVAMIYKWVPHAQVAWADVWMGAAITGALYLFGSQLIVVYLAHNALVAFYGGAGALVLVLLWAYYASQIFLFSVIKANFKSKPKERTEAGRQAGRLRQLPTDYPFLSVLFDTWMDSRKEKIRQMRTG